MRLSASPPFTLGHPRLPIQFARLAANRANREVQMLDKQTRGAILVLRRKGHSLRFISQLLSLSRQTVKKVIKMVRTCPQSSVV